MCAAALEYLSSGAASSDLRTWLPARQHSRVSCWLQQDGLRVALQRILQLRCGPRAPSIVRSSARSLVPDSSRRADWTPPDEWLQVLASTSRRRRATAPRRHSSESPGRRRRPPSPFSRRRCGLKLRDATHRWCQPAGLQTDCAGLSFLPERAGPVPGSRDRAREGRGCDPPRERHWPAWHGRLWVRPDR